jgi:hypothetical protein
MRWEQIPEYLDDWTTKVAAPAWDIKRAVAIVFTDEPVGYYYSPELEKVAFYSANKNVRDLALCRYVVSPVTGHEHLVNAPLTLTELGKDSWVKVAQSPTIRRMGELLNFFPGQYPGGIPNIPTPVAAMLTSGLVGGGLGYGTGWLLGKTLPGAYGKKLKRTGAILGALLGATPGAFWLGSRLAQGRDPFAISTAGKDPLMHDPSAYHQNEPWMQYSTEPIKLGSAYTKAVDNFVKSAQSNFGEFALPPIPTSVDVNINALGQTLWQGNASPSTAGTVMGTMYAAQQLPDRRSSPGMVTAGQLGQLAVNAGKDYLTGSLVGAAINQVIGTPFKASTFGATGAAVGLIKAVISNLFS